MVNQSRSRINRRNAKQKTGGALEKSTRNAMSHGIYSTCPPLSGTDDFDFYQSTKQALIEQFECELPTEFIAVEQVVMSLVRLSRLYRAEAAIIAKQQHDEEVRELEAQKSKLEPEPSYLSLDLSMFGEAEEVPPEIQKAIALLNEEIEEARKVKFETNVIVLDDKKQARLQREEGSIQRTLERNLDRLEQSYMRRKNDYLTQLEAQVHPDSLVSD